MDRLKKKGGVDKLRGQVRFSSLQYLTIRLNRSDAKRIADDRRRHVPQEILSVALKNYVLLSPEAINLDEENRLKLQAVANTDPLALIEYWAVDPDYDGQLFRSVWQDYRGNTANDGDEFRVVTSAKLTLTHRAGPRRVCVRAVDVFRLRIGGRRDHRRGSGMNSHASNLEQPNPLALWPPNSPPGKRAPCAQDSNKARPISSIEVTPITAELLQWWFGEEMVAARQGFNFHAGQRQAILNLVVAHEVLGATSLRELYRAAAPAALLASSRLAEISQDKHAYAKYCLKMATGTGKTWVLQAALVWQLLNKNAAIAEGRDDPRFTRHFIVVAPGLIVYERLLDAFCGRLIPGSANGARDFDSSDLSRQAELFIPEQHREAVLSFVRGNVCAKHEIGLKTTGNGMLAITNWHLLVDGDDEVLEVDEPETIVQGHLPDAPSVVTAVLPLTPGRATGNALDVLDRRHARGNTLEFLADLPELMAFNDEAHHIHEFKREGETA